MEQNQKICVSAFINYKHTVLIVRRSREEKFLPGFYELVGGKINFGETPTDALVRECSEEAYLAITPGKPYRVFSYVSDEGKRHTVDISFLATLNTSNQALVLSRAHDDYKWLEEKDIDQYLMTQEMRESIIQGFAHLNKST